ncbi:MAG TPA: rhomboid family intramembrane serine protease [Planctomycetota bacterium]|nr:rhomboid family intramembrane serine protease [Planctomycetota bacterium]
MRHGNATLLSLAPVTMTFLAVNVLLHFVTTARLEETGTWQSLPMLHRELIWEGEWARLIVPVFLHGGVMHLLMNSIALYQQGSAAEVHFGSSNYGTLYLLSGIVGCCFSSMFGAGRAVGASGALFGVMAAEVAVEVFKAPVLRNAWKRSEVRTSMAWLMLFFLMGVSGLMGSRIDNWGHFGGMVAGGLLGAFFELWRTRKRVGFPLFAATLLSIAALICVTRWSFFSPAYHIHQAWLAEEAGRTDEMDQELTHALRWARIWNKERTVATIIQYHNLGSWKLDTVRLAPRGYRDLERWADGAAATMDRLLRGENIEPVTEEP